MKDLLKRQVFLHNFDAVQEVVSTVHVTAGDKDYRIEILRDYKSRTAKYSASIFVKHEVPNPDPELKNVEGETLDAYLLDGSLPWVEKGSADAALEDALDHLQNRHPKKKQSGSAAQSALRGKHRNRSSLTVLVPKSQR